MAKIAGMSGSEGSGGGRYLKTGVWKKDGTPLEDVDEELIKNEKPIFLNYAAEFQQEMEAGLRDVGMMSHKSQEAVHVNNVVFPYVAANRADLRKEVKSQLNNHIPLDKDSTSDESKCRRNPRAVVYPTDKHHVSKIVQLANQLKWNIFIVAGGHGMDSWGCNDGLIISMLFLREIVVQEPMLGYGGHSLDHHGKVMVMSAGTNWAEAYAATDGQGSLMMAGSCATVGQAGYYSGGGFGYMSGSLGFGSDNVLEMELVIPSGPKAGTLVKANGKKDNEYKDLFNAVRGGNFAGLAIIVSTTVKMHPRNEHGCLFKVELDYGIQESLDVTWLNELMKKNPVRLHARARIERYTMGANKPELGVYKGEEVIHRRVVLTYLGEPMDSERNPPCLNRKQTATRVGTYLIESKAKLPLGFCKTPEDCYCDQDPLQFTDLRQTWMRCLLGPQQDPTGCASCSTTLWHADTWEEVFFVTSGEEDTGRRADKLIAGEGNLNSNTLFTEGYEHRTSTKSTMFRGELKQEMFDAVEASMRSDHSGTPSYASFSWWGGEQVGKDHLRGVTFPNRKHEMESVADHFREYRWLTILSTDFKDPKHNANALRWTTNAVRLLGIASGEPFQPYPNLYDRVHVMRTHAELEENGEDFAKIPEWKVWQIPMEAFWPGEEAKRMVFAAKAVYDPDNRLYSKVHTRVTEMVDVSKDVNFQVVLTPPSGETQSLENTDSIFAFGSLLFKRSPFYDNLMVSQEPVVSVIKGVERRFWMTSKHRGYVDEWKALSQEERTNILEHEKIKAPLGRGCVLLASKDRDSEVSGWRMQLKRKLTEAEFDDLDHVRENCYNRAKKALFDVKGKEADPIHGFFDPTHASELKNPDQPVMSWVYLAKPLAQLKLEGIEEECGVNFNESVDETSDHYLLRLGGTGDGKGTRDPLVYLTQVKKWFDDHKEDGAVMEKEMEELFDETMRKKGEIETGKSTKIRNMDQYFHVERVKASRRQQEIKHILKRINAIGLDNFGEEVRNIIQNAARKAKADLRNTGSSSSHQNSFRGTLDFWKSRGGS